MTVAAQNLIKHRTSNFFKFSGISKLCAHIAQNPYIMINNRTDTTLPIVLMIHVYLKLPRVVSFVNAENYLHESAMNQNRVSRM